jgi:hypothetical protein
LTLLTLRRVVKAKTMTETVGEASARQSMGRPRWFESGNPPSGSRRTDAERSPNGKSGSLCCATRLNADDDEKHDAAESVRRTAERHEIKQDWVI